MHRSVILLLQINLRSKYAFVWRTPCSKKSISSAQYNIHTSYIVDGRRPAADRAYNQQNTTFVMVILCMADALQQTENIISTIQHSY